LSSLSLAFIRPFATECAIEETDDNFLFGITPNVANDDDDDYEDLVRIPSKDWFYAINYFNGPWRRGAVDPCLNPARE
jgi:hypothetical protein